MEGLYLLIPLSLIFFVVAAAIFMWAVNNGQYEDLEGEAERILFETDDNHIVEVTLPEQEEPIDSQITAESSNSTEQSIPVKDK